jgi:hypothetical protein
LNDFSALRLPWSGRDGALDRDVRATHKHDSRGLVTVRSADHAFHAASGAPAPTNSSTGLPSGRSWSDAVSSTAASALSVRRSVKARSPRRSNVWGVQLEHKSGCHGLTVHAAGALSRSDVSRYVTETLPAARVPDVGPGNTEPQERAAETAATIAERRRHPLQRGTLATFAPDHRRGDDGQRLQVGSRVVGPVADRASASTRHHASRKRSFTPAPP